MIRLVCVVEYIGHCSDKACLCCGIYSSLL